MRTFSTKILTSKLGGEGGATLYVGMLKNTTFVV